MDAGGDSLIERALAGDVGDWQYSVLCIAGNDRLEKFICFADVFPLVDASFQNAASGNILVNSGRDIELRPDHHE